MKILVTDGDSRAALAITRSLGKRGHTICVAEKRAPSLASCSKYCSESFSYPDPANETSACIGTILEESLRRNIDLIIPVTDITLIPIVMNREHFETKIKLAVSDIASTEIAANKVSTYRLAEKLGVPVPKSICLESATDLGHMNLEKLVFPIVIKPCKSRVEADGKWLFTSVKYAESMEELSTVISSFPNAIFPVLLQERISGEGIGVFLCCDHGNTIAAFSHKRLREKPPSGGVSVLRESTHLNPLAYEYAKKLMAAIAWHGVAMVEFKLDSNDGIPKLMEINGRFWGSLQLAIDSGIDFPNMLVELISKGSCPASFDYRIGVKTRWLWGDVDLLIMRLIKSDKELHLPHGYSSRLKSVVEFMKFFGTDLHYEVLQLDDLRPWLYESALWVRTTFGLR